MAPGTVLGQNGMSTEPYRTRPKYQHYSLPRNLKKEYERLKTFINWNVDFLDCKKLAKAGFYYTNTADIVKCAFCNLTIGEWKQGDDPEEEHKRLLPKCPNLTGRRCEEEEEEDEEGEGEDVEGGEVASQDVCGSYGLEIRPFSAPERPGKTPFAIESSNLCRNFEELGVSRISGPVSPYYATLNSRLQTFETWPIPEIQSPEKLAEAGFYYTSSGDNVLCFHCGGGLKNWEPDDDPLVEHARWFNRCGFVILRMGRAFVNECLAKQRSQQGDDETVKEHTNGRETVEQLQEAEEEEEEEKNVREEDEERKTREEKAKRNLREENVLSVSPSASSSSRFEKENQPRESPDPERKEIELCRICYVRERGIVFLPCGHFVSCTQCAPSLSTCAVCRKPFEATVRAYLS